MSNQSIREAAERLAALDAGEPHSSVYPDDECGGASRTLCDTETLADWAIAELAAREQQSKCPTCGDPLHRLKSGDWACIECVVIERDELAREEQAD